MKIFATNYLEAMSEDADGGKGSGKATKSTILTYAGCDSQPDEDFPQEGMAGGMLIA